MNVYIDVKWGLGPVCDTMQGSNGELTKALKWQDEVCEVSSALYIKLWWVVVKSAWFFKKSLIFVQNSFLNSTEDDAVLICILFYLAKSKIQKDDGT